MPMKVGQYAYTHPDGVQVAYRLLEGLTPNHKTGFFGIQGVNSLFFAKFRECIP